MLAVYGIPNCDSVKKARAWLAAAEIAHQFHDFKKAGLPQEALARWIAAVGWAALLNRKGTTWRQLDDPEREGAADALAASRLMLAHPTLIKRPVIEWPERITVGFDAREYLELSRR